MHKSSHSVTDLRYHIILVTKKRRPLLTGGIEECVKSECDRIIRHFEGTVIEMETGRDHIHMLVELPPRYSISEVVNVLKGVSARITRRDYLPEIQKQLSGDAFWSPSYYAATVGGVTLEVLKQYVQDQKNPEHRNR